MSKHLVILLGLAFAFGSMQATTQQDTKPANALSDTVRTQAKDTTRQRPIHKTIILFPDSGKNKMWKPDSLNPEIYLPLLRQKDSTVNNPH